MTNKQILEAFKIVQTSINQAERSASSIQHHLNAILTQKRIRNQAETILRLRIQNKKLRSEVKILSKIAKLKTKLQEEIKS